MHLKKIISIMLLMLHSLIAFCDAANIQISPGGNVQPISNEAIILKNEQIEITLFKREIQVVVNYYFENTGTKQKVLMGFPNSKNRTMTGEFELGIKDFKAYQDNQALTTFRKEKEKQDFKHRIDLFECFYVSFDQNEVVHITNTYTQKYLNTNSDDQIVAEYILKTGATWKKNIDSVKVFITSRIPLHELKDKSAYFVNIDGEMLHKKFTFNIQPGDYQKKQNVFSYEYKNIEPTFNIRITRPPLTINSVKASSVLKSKSNRYQADHLLDGDYSTTWVEGEKNSGQNVFVQFDTTPYFKNDAGAYKVQKIGLVNGYAKNKSVFLKNNRLKKIRLDYVSHITPGETSYRKLKNNSLVFTLKDSMQPQYLTFKKAIYISNFKITILDVYKGTQWDDTCLSEIWLELADSN